MAAVTVTTSPTLVFTCTQGSASAPEQVFVTNNSGSTVFLGEDESVVAGSGIQVPTGGAWSAELTLGRKVYGIVAAGTAEVRAEGF